MERFKSTANFVVFVVALCGLQGVGLLASSLNALLSLLLKRSIVKTLILTFVFLLGLFTQARAAENAIDNAVIENKKELETKAEEIKKTSAKEANGKDSSVKEVYGKDSNVKDVFNKDSNGKDFEQKELNTKDLSVKGDFDEAQINYKGADEESTPILTKSKNKVEEQSGTIYKTLSIVFLLFAAGGIGLWYLKKKSLMGDNKQTLTQIKVLTQYHLAPRKTLTVIRVAGESLLIGVTENQITLLKSLSLLDEDIPDSTPKSFKQTIAESSAEACVDAPPKNTVLKSVEFTDSDEEFSFGNIKHLVENKLKGMKRW